MQIERQKEFMRFMELHGPDSPDSRLSYVSYLESASKYSGIGITQKTCANETDISLILSKCEDKHVNRKTQSNFRSALRKYVKMVADLPAELDNDIDQVHQVKAIMGKVLLGDYEAILLEKATGDHAIALNSLKGGKIAILTMGKEKLAAEEFWIFFRKNVQSVWVHP